MYSALYRCILLVSDAFCGISVYIAEYRCILCLIDFFYFLSMYSSLYRCILEIIDAFCWVDGVRVVVITQRCSIVFRLVLMSSAFESEYSAVDQYILPWIYTFSSDFFPPYRCILHWCDWRLIDVLSSLDVFVLRRCIVWWCIVWYLSRYSLCYFDVFCVTPMYCMTSLYSLYDFDVFCVFFPVCCIFSMYSAFYQFSI